MSNCLLAYPDRTLKASVSGGNWQTTFPLSNIKDDNLYMVTRSVSVNVLDTVCNIDLGASIDIRVLAILGHNASADATVRIRLSNNADMSEPIYDQTKPFWFTRAPQGGLPWGHPDFWDGGLVSDEDRANFPKQFFVTLTENYSIQARYVRCEFFDTTNPDSYFEFSRCFVAPAWQPSVNMGYGLQFGYESATKPDTLDGGVTVFDIKASRRICNFSLEVPSAQGVTYLFEIQRILDIYSELFFVYNPDDATMLEQLRSFICTMRSLSLLETPYFDANTMGFQLQEKL